MIIIMIKKLLYMYTHTYTYIHILLNVYNVYIISYVPGETRTDDTRISVAERKTQNLSFAPAYRGHRANPNNIKCYITL